VSIRRRERRAATVRARLERFEQAAQQRKLTRYELDTVERLKLSLRWLER
jgi:hypothetical protein